ncbi:MAG: ATP-binding cassette domain-containing protein [Streptosporangiales bacterium]|nr:ATP-binding cassette domain-containing protein [Streptosporangiales bacterium]
MDRTPAEPLLEARNLTKYYPLARKAPWSRRTGVVRAVDGISFSLGEQETISLVGESGCGKTTTARMILDLERPTKGEIVYRSRDLRTLRGSSRLEYRTSVQAVFQDPTTSLDPRRRVRAIVGEPLAVNRKLSHGELNRHVDELLTAVGLDLSQARSFPHELSGGMRQRVAVAQSLALRPSLIVLDEPVSALDVSIRAQIMNLLKDLQTEFGLSYLLIAHDLATVRYLSDQVAALYLGQIVEIGDSEIMFTRSLHPYTLALISAADSSEDRDGRPRIVLQGDVASPADPPSGCRFHPRCWLRTQLSDTERCTTEAPALRPLGENHRVACHFAETLTEPEQRKRLLDVAREASRDPADTTPATPTGVGAAPGRGEEDWS